MRVFAKTWWGFSLHNAQEDLTNSLILPLFRVSVSFNKFF